MNESNLVIQAEIENAENVTVDEQGDEDDHIVLAEYHSDDEAKDEEKSDEEDESDDHVTKVCQCKIAQPEMASAVESVHNFKVKGKYEHLKNPATIISIFPQKYAKFLIQHYAVVSWK